MIFCLFKCMNFSCFQLMQSLNVQVIWNVMLTKFATKVLVFLHVVESPVDKMLFACQNFTKEAASAFLGLLVILTLDAARVIVLKCLSKLLSTYICTLIFRYH